jgi:hypothetical protein
LNVTAKNKLKEGYGNNPPPTYKKTVVAAADYPCAKTKYSGLAAVLK